MRISIRFGYIKHKMSSLQHTKRLKNLEEQHYHTKEEMADGNEIDKQLADLEAAHGFTRPDRGDLNDPKVHWREGKPDYRKADLIYYQGKTRNHAPGSLEMIVENLVKKWEMELTHLPNPEEWSSVDLTQYLLQVNGGKEVTANETAKIGSYNSILQNAPKDLYNAAEETFESSHGLFRKAMPKGFPWEVVQVFSGPPKVAFSWRHWGTFDGQYKDIKGEGQPIEFYGFAIATVNAELKITRVEVYTKYEGFLRAFQGNASQEEKVRGHELVGSGCPINHS